MCERGRDELCDDLYDRARSASAEVRRRVLVPLRRDVHNRRSPKSTLRTALAGLENRSPSLDTWLTARDGIDRAVARLAVLGGPALRADRDALAGLCRSEDVQRAVALISEDLLRAVRRAAEQGAEPDKQGRKSEAAVLRYAMRAVTRTNPLSWFTHVGWGRWQEEPRTGDATGRASRPPWPGCSGPCWTPWCRPSAGARSCVPYWTTGLLRAYAGRRVAACSSAERRRGRASLVDDALRTGPRGEGSPAVDPGAAPGARPQRSRGAVRKQDLAAEHRFPASRTAAAGGAGRSRLRHLACRPGVAPARAPFDPQTEDAVREASRWWPTPGSPNRRRPWPSIGSDTERYTHLPAKSRPAALARIRTRWSAAFSLVGAPPVSPKTPLTEESPFPGRHARPGHGRRPCPISPTRSAVRAVRRACGDPPNDTGPVRRPFRSRRDL